MPQTFTDSTGRVWCVAIGTDTIKRVRSLLSVDLMEFVEGPLMAKLANDIVLFVDVLYAVCKPEADARNVSDADFGRSMNGDTLAAAEEALAEGLFCISHPSRRDLARKAWEKIKRLRMRACEMASERMDAATFDQMIEASLQAELDKALAAVRPASPPPTPGSSSGSSPG